MAENDEWTVERLVAGGDGFLRLSDGRAAFVTGAFPGDVIEPTRIEERRGYVRARQWRLVRSGPYRVEPACAVADRCGGCDWMRLDLSAQREHKAQLLSEALRRTAKLPSLQEPVQVTAAGPALRYRHRLRLHVDINGRVGLYARGSHDIIEIVDCPVSREEIARALTQIRQVAENYPGALAEFESIELRYAPRPPALCAYFFQRTRRPLTAPMRALLAELCREFPATAASSNHCVQQYPLGDLILNTPPGVFTQVNWAANLALVDALVTRAQELRLRTFCDLFCGVGNFSLPLIHAGLTGVAIDKSKAAVRAAAGSAELNALPTADFRAADVQAETARLARQGARFDLVVLNPPRAGALAVLRDVARIAANRIAYCSCDPATLARDLAILMPFGYNLESIRGFDLFPQTHHLETLVWLRRSSKHA